MYSVSGGRRWTPKHVGLGSSLHQATRCKKLVEIFHNAGHTISYLDIRRVDTALAKHTLSTMNTENGTVTPVNPAEGRFIHFAADNIDVKQGTLDGQTHFLQRSMQPGKEVQNQLACSRTLRQLREQPSKSLMK